VSSKIGGVDGSSSSAAIGAGRAVQAPQDAATGGTQTSSGSGGNGGSVQITNTARQLATLEQAVRDTPPVNDARVAQLSSAIEQGTYSVNSQHVADRLIQMDKELSRIPNQADADSDADPDAD
jgi:negative regulator of flagellin synthesis FlgM